MRGSVQKNLRLTNFQFPLSAFQNTAFQNIDAARFPAHTCRMAKKTAAKPNAAWPAHAGFVIGEICSLTKIDRWFLVQINEIMDFEEELAVAV